jgi:putative transposase
MSHGITRKRYPSDLTDAQWELLAPLILPPSPNATQETIPRREIVNGILYVLRTGCSWRQMPHDLPNCQTVYHYFRSWQRDGTWEKAMHALRRQVRVSMGREAEPSAAILDSQSSKTSPVPGIERGYDAGKKLWGRKRHALVDTQGFILAVIVLAANITDRAGAHLLLEGLAKRFPRLSHLFADHGYDGEPFEQWLSQHLGWQIEIVPPPSQWVLINGQPVELGKPQGGCHLSDKIVGLTSFLAWYKCTKQVIKVHFLV